jgi:hypothetical protein
MLEYNPENPLVFIHLFKTAGSSLRNIFMMKWFIERFVEHKDGEVRKDSLYVKGLTCCSDYISKLKSEGLYNPIFFGHFDETGIYKFPEECNQFMTILRNPFDIQVSAYFFIKQEKLETEHNCVEDFILKSSFAHRFSNVFTKEKMTSENYKEIIQKYFIAIGSLKNYEKSLKIFSEVLGVKYTPDLLDIKINETKKSSDYYIPNHLREEHRKLFPLEYEIYDYVNDLYEY